HLFKSRKSKFKIETRIESHELFEKVNQTIEKYSKGVYTEIEPQNFPWDSIFITGYGAGVRNLGTNDYQYYFAIDALYSLFKYDVTLQNPELSLRRMIDKAREDGGEKSAKETKKHLMQLLKRILNLDKDDKIELTSISIEVISKRWGRNELSTLGDGYISTITWILDLFSWWMLNLKQQGKKLAGNLEIKGIVLIDEIEQHLHPVWKVKIMPLLQDAFPNIQFISTTHSPLVVLNSSKDPLKSPELKVHVLNWQDKSVTSSVVNEPIVDLDYNQLLGSEAFGYISNSNQILQSVLAEMSKLVAIDNPNKKQKEKLEVIKAELKNIMFPEGGTLIERVIEREYYEELEKKADYLKGLLD
ncbi:MAG: AAA family ATPase, partial [Bacteroidota bacterium]